MPFSPDPYFPDFASRSPGLRDFRRSQHALQTQAGHWLGEFDRLLQENPKQDIADYLGEYRGVGQWN